MNDSLKEKKKYDKIGHYAAIGNFIAVLIWITIVLAVGRQPFTMWLKTIGVIHALCLGTLFFCSWKSYKIVDDTIKKELEKYKR